MLTHAWEIFVAVFLSWTVIATVFVPEFLRVTLTVSDLVVPRKSDRETESLELADTHAV
jgi:hypothetical protein